MAHCFHYLLKEGFTKLDDDLSTVDFTKVDLEKVNEMDEQNYLRFNSIKVFSLKVDEHVFAFVFAKDELEAINYTKNKLNENPSNCIEYMMDVEMEKGNRVLSFRDMKK